MFTPIKVPSRNRPDQFATESELAIAGIAQFILDYNQLGSVLNGAITGSSITSLAIGTGTKSPQLSAGLNLVPGYPVRLAYRTDPTKYMDGVVLTYDGVTGAFAANISSVQGSGTYADWQVMVLPAAGDYAGKGANKYTGQQVLANEVTVATSSLSTTLDLTTGGSNQYLINGTDPVAVFTIPQGVVVKARFGGACPITHGSGTILPGAANYTTAAGDIFTMVKDPDGNVRVEISRITGRPVINPITTAANDGSFAKDDGDPVSSSWVKALLALRGMRKLGTLNTTTGASQVLSSLDLSKYTKLEIYIKELSSTTSAIFTINGFDFTASNLVAAQSTTGKIEVNLDDGVYASTQFSSGGVNFGKSGTSTISKLTTALTFACSAGTFDGAGSLIDVYGVI